MSSKTKDKEAVERANRELHKAHLREAKRRKRRQEPSLERVSKEKEEKPTILIVCEGKNTEPSYFNQFRLTSAFVKPVGASKNTLSLVEEAIELEQEENYDQVWCVFDKDDFKDFQFNNAINKAEKHHFGVAYSNQAFEYWLILHFEDHQGGGMHRKDYPDKINNYLKPYGVRYDGKGSKIITDAFFDLLESQAGNSEKNRVDCAIERAERNYQRLDHFNPAKEESSTTVFKLVKELKKYV